jgi:hypothetical protein
MTSNSVNKKLVQFISETISFSQFEDILKNKATFFNPAKVCWITETGSRRYYDMYWIDGPIGDGIAGGSDTSLIAYVNTYGPQTVNGAKTFSSTVTGARFDPTANTATGTGMFAPSSSDIGFSISNTEGMRLNSNKKLLIGNTTNAQSTDVGIADLQLENINFGTLQMIGYRNTVDGGYIGLYKARGQSFVTANRTNILNEIVYLIKK